MNLTQINQLFTSFNMDPNMLLQFLRENMDSLEIANSPEMRNPILHMLEELHLNFYQEIRMYSPTVNTHRDISYSTEVVQLHSHPFYELLYCESGNIQYLIGEHRYSIHSGDIVLVPPGISHRPIFHEQLKEPYSRIVLWVSNEFVSDLIKIFPDYEEHRKHMQNHFLIRTSNSAYGYLKNYFLRGVKEAQEKKLGWEGALYYSSGMLLTELYRLMNLDDIALPAEKEDMIDQIIFYIENNYASKITLEETAKRFLISQSTLSKLFKNRLAISFYRFVTQRRLINAKKRIEEGELLDKLGTSCGFNDYATFYRAFKKEYGISPKDYQKLVSLNYS